MYLEISNIAAALGKNPYESREKMLLINWARHCPKIVLKYLLENKCIMLLGEDEETFTEVQKEIYKKICPEDFDVKDFDKIEKKIVEEYKKERGNKQTEIEVKQLISMTKDSLKKNNGCKQENNIIQEQKYKKGNDKMYYFNITDDGIIGGKHDATNNDILLEIKTRTRKQNVRRNDYDLYQLIGYLLATNTQKGKIVQIYNKEKFDSDEATDIEYGIVDITQPHWIDLSKEIISGLEFYFQELSTLISTSEYKYLSNVIPKTIRPIAKMNDDTFCDDNVKFKNLLRHLC
jgi:hypothetical protein